MYGSTKFFWKPLNAWCRQHRLTRLRDEEQEAYKSAFRAYKQALKEANVDCNTIRDRTYRLAAADMEGFRRAIQDAPYNNAGFPYRRRCRVRHGREGDEGQGRVCTMSNPTFRRFSLVGPGKTV